MILNEREIKILEKFYFKDNITISELSKEFEVSERMVRYNIDKINNVLKFLKLSTIKKLEKGIFYLDIKNNIELIKIIKKLEPLNKEKREILIQFNIIFSKSKKRISYFSEELNISRMTVINDIKNINKMILKYNIQIINKNGLVLNGNNEDIRKYIINILSKQIYLINKESENEFSNILKSLLFENITKNMFFKIKSFISDLMNDFDIKTNDINYNIFFSQILYIFIFKNNVINNFKLKETYEYTYTFNKLKELSLLKYVNEENILNIVDSIIWIKSYENYEKYHENWFNIEIIVKNIILYVEKNIRVNISNDNLLYEFLIQHLKAMIYRNINGYSLKKNEIKELNKDKDELYKIIEKSLYMLKNICNEDINEDEIFLLKTHFLASIKRIQMQQEKPEKIMIITSLGPGSKQILINNIKNNFLVDIVYVGPLFKLDDKLKNIKVKYILTTMDIKNINIKGITIIKINAILTDLDKKILINNGFKNNPNKVILSNLLNIINKNCKINDYEKLLKDLISNFGDKIVDDLSEDYENENVISFDNIIFDYKSKNIKEAIIKSLTVLEDKYINKTYTEDVLKIFEENSNYIIRYNGVIFPHTKNKGNVYKTGVSIICLKEPLIIDDTKEKIDTILTFVIKDEKKNLNMISDIINKAFQIKFKKVLKEKNKIKLISYLQEKR